jgi:hypothetical protein
MAARKNEPAGPATVEIPLITTYTIDVCVLGKRPLICNRMSEKAQRELLSPAGRKTTAQKQSTLKHNPLEEFRASPYILKEDDAPTYLALMSSAFKGAMATAALDLPGANKTQIGRLVWVEGDYTPVYGIPQLFMAVTRSADMNKTPDIRTRAIVKHWAAKVAVSFVTPLINEQAIANLMVAAGQTVGVGDYRPQKGKGTYGQFEVVTEDDARFRAVLRDGRASQLAAMQNPDAYDQDTEDLLSWWTNDTQRRGMQRRAWDASPSANGVAAPDEAEAVAQ